MKLGNLLFTRSINIVFLYILYNEFTSFHSISCEATYEHSTDSRFTETEIYDHHTQLHTFALRSDGFPSLSGVYQ